MSGIATQTARSVEAVAGTPARVVDTRKTTPGLRALKGRSKRRTAAANHRYRLGRGRLAADKRSAVLAAAGIPVGEAIRRAREHRAHRIWRSRSTGSTRSSMAAGVDTIMLDNFTPGRAARRCGPRRRARSSRPAGRNSGRPWARSPAPG
ncbi:MAG: hypothetical protein R2717_07890 [Schumannella sp.]